VTNFAKKLTLFILFFISFLSMSSPYAYDNVETQVENNSLDINTLFKPDDYRNVTLSPDGKHIALIRNQEGIPMLIIVAVDTMKAVNQIYFAKKDSVGSYVWANNERLLIFLSSKQRNEERKAYYGEIYSINIDEDKGKFIFGVRSLVRRGKIKKGTQGHDYEKHLAHPEIISVLKNDPKHIIISTSQYGDKGMWVYKLNVYGGKIETLARIEDTRANHTNTRLNYFDTRNELWLTSTLEAEDVLLARYNFDDNSWFHYRPKNAQINEI